MADNTDNPYRVKLTSRNAQPPYGYNKVVFEVTPELVESRTVNYNSQDPVHMPGQVYVYKNTQARSFSISGAILQSRTPQEAENTLTKLWMLKGWTQPRFGVNSSTQGSTANSPATQFQRANANPSTLFTDLKFLRQSTGELLGSPPEVVYLSAYANQPAPQPAPNDGLETVTISSGNAFSGGIANVPVVISSLTIPYPTDVDYIKSAVSNVRVPIMMRVDIQLLEAHSAQEYEQFSLDDFKRGQLAGF